MKIRWGSVVLTNTIGALHLFSCGNYDKAKSKNDAGVNNDNTYKYHVQLKYKYQYI